MTQYAADLHDLVAHTSANQDLAAAACRMISAAPETEQPELFCRFLLEYKYTESDESRPNDLYFSRADIKLYKTPCQELLKQWMEELKKEHPEETEFHAALWKRICGLSNEILRAMMVFVCAEDPHLPYLAPSRKDLGSGYTTESFKAAAQQLDPIKTGLVHHILHQDYERVSEDAAALLPLLEACASQKEKVLLLSMMFLAIHQKIDLSEIQDFLRTSVEEDLDRLIREAIAEFEEDT